MSALLHDKMTPKDCQVLSLDDSGFLQFFRIVSSAYGKPRDGMASNILVLFNFQPRDQEQGITLWS